MSTSPTDDDLPLTLFLRDPRAADEAIAAAALPVVYAELRAIAEAATRRGRKSGDLEPTALVHEAYLKLFERTGLELHDREHFYALAARAMRQLAVDHARARRAAKRGGDALEVTLDEVVQAASGLDLDLLDLDAALDELAALDPREARVVELRFFAGMDVDQVALVLGISRTTVEREWRAARAWLGRKLKDEAP